MGNCCGNTSAVTVEEDLHIALKFPHGLGGLYYDDHHSKALRPLDNVNVWLRNIYQSSKWKSWIVYNDETGSLGLSGHSNGHCKGIVAWNNDHISWLVHSLPNFPRNFTGNTISDVEPGEMIYGQYFCYIKFPYRKDLCDHVIEHLTIMGAHIFQQRLDGVDVDKKILDQPRRRRNRGADRVEKVSELRISDRVSHVAKSSHHHIDIYSEYLCTEKDTTSLWQVETWKRGSRLHNDDSCIHNNSNSDNNHKTKTHGHDSHHKDDNHKHKHIHDVQLLQTQQGKEMKQTQDHSKWAVSDIYCFIGDLNRMDSQRKRGGGGLLIRHPDLAHGFKELIKS